MTGSVCVYGLSAIEDSEAAHFALHPDVNFEPGLTQLVKVSSAPPIVGRSEGSAPCEGGVEGGKVYQ